MKLEDIKLVVLFGGMMSLFFLNDQSPTVWEPVWGVWVGMMIGLAIGGYLGKKEAK